MGVFALLEALFDVGRAIVERAEPPLRALIRTTMRRLERAARLAVGWLVLLLIVAMLPTRWLQSYWLPTASWLPWRWFPGHWISVSYEWDARNIVTILAFLSLVPIVWYLTSGRVLLGGLLIEATPYTAPLIGKFRILAEHLAKRIAKLVGCGLLFSLYLTCVPIANDRFLALRLIIMLAAMVCFIGDRSKIVQFGMLIGVAAAIIITWVFFLGGRTHAFENGTREIKDAGEWIHEVSPSLSLQGNHQGATRFRGVVNERGAVCPDAFWRQRDGVNNHRTEKGLFYFDVVLHGDECFMEDIVHPKEWGDWDKMFISNGPDDHFSIWFHGWNPLGPFFPNNIPRFNDPPSSEFRLKGVGVLRFYRTDKSVAP